MSQHFKTIQSYLPWIQSPLIVNAPMESFAGSQLATAVTKAGGHGQIGSIGDADVLEKQLAEVQANFAAADGAQSGSTPSSTLPVSVGFLVFLVKLDPLLPTIAKYKPAVVWLFAAPSLDDYTTWATRIRAASPPSKIWVQAGSVAAALHLASTAKPDALILQGSDAGGHGFEKGASIVSLVPETAGALSAAGFGHVPLLASGGIVDGRGVAAALSLGAAGVVMGTRFLSATETVIHPQYRARVLQTADGGQTTTRSKVFDELYGPSPWPVEYNGRALVAASYNDHRGGVNIEEIRKLHAVAIAKEHAGFGDGVEEEGRAAMWMGSAVGLVNQVQSAREIVEEVREGTRRALQAAMEKL